MRSRTDSKSVTMELINKMRSSQYNLQIETSMNYMEKTYREEELRNLETKYYEKLKMQKDHYMNVYTMLKYYEHGEVWPAYHFVMQLEAGKPVGKRTIQFMSPTGLLNKITTVDTTQRDLIDALTFSLVPSFCHYFFTESGVIYFSQLMHKCKDMSLYYSLARVVFVSPEFMRFIACVFKPILSLSIADKNLSAEDVAMKIKQSWRDNIELIPEFVYRLLKTSEFPERVLSDSFFNIALTETSVCVYNMLEYYQTISSELLAVLRELLIFPGEQSICEDLVHITLQSNNKEENILTYDNEEEVPVLFQSYLLSWIDHNVLSSVSRGVPFVDPICYDAAMCIQEGEREQSSRFCAYEATMRGVSLEASIRHLLQATDPIPVFQEPPEDMSIADFVMKILVARGPRSTQFKRLAAYQNILQVRNQRSLWADDTEWLRALDKVVLDRTKEIQALSALTLILAKFEKMSSNTEHARLCIMKLQNYISVCKLIETMSLEYHSVTEYITDWKNLNEDYLKLFTEFENKAPSHMKTIPYFTELLYAYLTRDFTDAFVKYREQRQQECQYDEEVNQFYRENLEKCVNDIFPVQNVRPGKFDEYKCMKEAIIKIQDRPDIINIIIGACCESNPLRKLCELQRGVDMAMNFVHTFFPPGETFGGDQMSPITIGFLTVCNAPFMLTNWMYIKNLIDNVPTAKLSNPHIIGMLYRTIETSRVPIPEL